MSATTESLSGETISFPVRGGTLAATRWTHEPGRAHAGGDPIVFLHGGGQTRFSWGTSAGRFARQGWNVVSLDLRGHGESDWFDDGYALDSYVGDLEQVVEQLGRRPVLVGASLGGMTSLLAQGEGRVDARGLVLVDITPRVEIEGRERIVGFMTAHKDGFADLDEVLDAVAAYTPHRKVPKNYETIQRNVRLHEDGRWYWHWDPRMLQRATDRSPDQEEGRLYAAARAIDVPTMLVRGRHSDIVSPEGASELLELIPGSELVVVDAGHMVAGDDNDVFALRVSEFLEQFRG